MSCTTAKDSLLKVTRVLVGNVKNIKVAYSASLRPTLENDTGKKGIFRKN